MTYSTLRSINMYKTNFNFFSFNSRKAVQDRCPTKVVENAFVTFMQNGKAQ